LSLIAKLDCDVCSPDMESFYDICASIVSMNERMYATARKNIYSKTFAIGRVVVLRDKVCHLLFIDIPERHSKQTKQHFNRNNLGIFIKASPVPITYTKETQPLRTFFVLALVDEDTKSKKYGGHFRSIL